MLPDESAREKLEMLIKLVDSKTISLDQALRLAGDYCQHGKFYDYCDDIDCIVEAIMES